ncbi:MAG: CshA/CshB family fibrillar adhesin-related protein, partial [Oscillospiraceae bacterium]
SQEGVNLTNIVVKDANGVVQTNFKWVAADGETTDTDETWSVTTDGSPWSQLTVLPPVVPPANTPGVSGLGTSTVTQVGTGANHANGNVYITTAPKNVSARFFTYGREAVVFGIIFDPFETAVSQLIESVALEQTALSHILNAEV